MHIKNTRKSVFICNKGDFVNQYYWSTKKKSFNPICLMTPSEKNFTALKYLLKRMANEKKETIIILIIISWLAIELRKLCNMKVTTVIIRATGMLLKNRGTGNCGNSVNGFI